MTVLDRDPLQWFVQLCQRRGVEQWVALQWWRQDGNRISNSKFREVWNQQKERKQ